VTTFKFIRTVKSDPESMGLLGFTVREPVPGLMEFPSETLTDVLVRLEREGPSLLSWEDFCGFCSVRGVPKPRQLTHETFVGVTSEASPVKKDPGREIFTQTEQDPPVAAKRPITAIPTHEEPTDTV
jgi:hypothetical protein